MTPPQPRPRPPRVPAALWRMAFAAGLAFYLDAATVISVAIALPVWRSHFGLALWEVGTLTAGLALAIASGSWPAAGSATGSADRGCSPSI